MKRIILGGFVAAAAVTAIPSAANAATCNYSDATKTMTVTYRAGESSVSVRPSGTLQYSDGGFYQNCFDSSTGKAATPTTLARLNIRAATGTGAQGQTTILDESAATFADFNRFTDIAITTGTNDQLRIKRGAKNDLIHLRELSGGLAVGPAIDLDFNGEDDVRMITDDSVVRVDAGAGNDAIEASEVTSYRTAQFGEAGDDFLFGGKQVDVLDGGLGTDSAPSTDRFRDQITSIEKFF